MNKYESIIVLKPKLENEKIQQVIKRIEDFINDKGKVLLKEEWGKKKLTYPIQKHNEGYYVLFDFKTTSKYIEEINKLYNVIEEVIKHIIVKKY